MMAVAQGPRVTPTGHDSIPQSQSVKPSFKLFPGYIASFGSAVVEGGVEPVRYLKVDILNPEIWRNLADKKQNIIDNNKFIYFKLDAQDNKLLEIGIHIAMCKKIEEFKLEKIRLGDSIRDENPKMVAMNDTSYERMKRSHLSLLA